MKPPRRFAPSAETLEGRAVPTLVLLADIDSGYGAPGIPRPPWEEKGLNFLGPTVTGNDYDTLGYGGHGTEMADLYAQSLARLGVQAHVVPLVACGPTTGFLSTFMPASYTSDAIGRAELWVAQQQRVFNAEGRDVRWIVSLPAEPHPVNVTEFFGRLELDQLGIPIIQAGGNNGWYGSTLFFDHSPTALVAEPSVGAPYTASFVTIATTPAGYGSSGATMATAAWLTADTYAHPWWPSAWDTWDVSHRGVLPGF